MNSNSTSKQTGTFTSKRWTAATFSGWLLGVIFILLLSSALDAAGIEHMQFYLGVGMGAGVGLTQWWLLRRFLPVGRNWILISVLGMGAPFIITDLILAGMMPYKLPASIVPGSCLIGLLQYLILKNHFQKAWFWIPGCLLGWTLAVAMVFTVDYTRHLKPIVSSNLLLAFINLLLILGGGVVLGVITGSVLKKILKG